MPDAWTRAGVLASTCLLPSAGLAAPIQAQGSYLANGGFEAGFSGWEKKCIQHCGVVEMSSSARTGSGALALRSTANDWTAVELRQQLSALPKDGALHFEAFSRADSSDTPLAPAQLELELAFDVDDGTGGSARKLCRRQWTDLPSGTYKPHRLACSVPMGAARVWASIRFACVRARADLLIDDVSLTPHAATAPPAQEAVALRAEGTPRRLHLIFGLARDFGGKPFGLVHHVVVKAAARFFRPEAIFLHHVYEPSGECWEASRSLLRLRRVTPPTSIFGRTVRKFQHQASANPIAAGYSRLRWLQKSLETAP